MFSLDFWYFSMCFSYEIELYMKSARQVEMSLETFILRIQLYIPAFSLTVRKPLACTKRNLVQ